MAMILSWMSVAEMQAATVLPWTMMPAANTVVELERGVVSTTGSLAVGLAGRLAGGLAEALVHKKALAEPGRGLGRMLYRQQHVARISL